DALHRGRDMDLHGRSPQPILAALTAQYSLLSQGLDHFFHEKRRAFGLLQHQPLEPRETGVGPQQKGEQFFGLRSAQRRKSELSVIGLTAPLMAVLGPVIHQHQEAGTGHTLTEQIEKALRLGIDPVQVLENENERLIETFPQEEAFERLERAPPPDLRV